MPYIEVKTTGTLAPERKTKLAGRLVEAFAETSERKVAANIQMVITDGCWISFRGDEASGSAHVQVCPGPLTPEEDYIKIVEAFFPVLVEELGITRDHIYINVLEFEHWGYDGIMVVVEKNKS